MKASPKHGRVLIKVGISVVYVIFPISFHETLTVLQYVLPFFTSLCPNLLTSFLFQRFSECRLSEMHSSADSLLTSAERKGLPIVCVGGFCDVDGTVSLYRMDEPSSPFLDVFRAAQMHDGSASIGKSEEE